MVIQPVTRNAVQVPSIDEIMAETGMPRDAAALHRLILSGDALVDDLEFIPDGDRERVIKEEEEAEARFLAAMEQAAKLVDPAATVDENIALTGLDRETVELYLTFLATRS